MERLTNLSPEDWWPRYSLTKIYERQDKFEVAVHTWEFLVTSSTYKDPVPNRWLKRLDRAFRLSGGSMPVLPKGTSKGGLVKIGNEFWPERRKILGMDMDESSEEETASKTQILQKDERMSRSMTTCDSPY